MKANAEQRQAARDYYQSEDLFVCDDAQVEVVEDGCWVQAWVWVPTETGDTV